jgi:transcriptional regulator with XRE-family HTH domain
MVKKSSGDARATTSVDEHIGARVRARRLELRISQERLANDIGVTFQQVQKYEKGVNRIAASTLVDIAAALTIQPAALLPKTGRGAPASSLDDPEFSALLGRLNDEGRRILARIGRDLANDDELRARKRPS